VDTRSDVYSLGVLLYELLVGALPIDPQRLRQAALGEVLRLIREDEPPKPTTRIENLGDTATDVARQRQTSVRALLRFLRGDLDWITMRALEKNPARRYESASEFAADIERHLSGEPVAAGPPGPAYRVWKLARKHRVAAAAVLAVLASLALWTGIMSVLYVRAVRARKMVQTEMKFEEFFQLPIHDRRHFRALSAEVIEGNRRVMGQTPSFAGSLLLHLVLHHQVSGPPGPPIMSVEQVENFKPPEVRALESEAVQIIERSLDNGESGGIDLVSTMIELEVAFDDQAALERLFVKAFDLEMKSGSAARQDLLGKLAELLERTTPQTLERGGEREAESLLRRIAAFRRTGTTSVADLPQTLSSLAEILTRRGSRLRRQGAAPAAEPVLREALELMHEVEGLPAREDSEAATGIAVLDLESELGACLIQTGKFAEAEALLRHASDELNRSLGSRSIFTQVVMNRLRDLYEREGKVQMAKTLRTRLPAVSARDVWDFGPVGAISPIDKMMAVQLGDASAIVFTDRSSRPSGGWGRLDKNSEGYVRIAESKDPIDRKDFLPFTSDESSANTEHRLMNCEADASDCHTRWILKPHGLVADAARGRALVFYSKWKNDGLKGKRGERIRIGTSLAVWRNVELPAERPVFQPSSQEPTLLFGQDEPEWGTAAFVSGNTLFVYANSLLAQVPLDQAMLRNAWKFYAGSGSWSENWRDARPVPGVGNASPLSVHWNDYVGKYLLAAAIPPRYDKVPVQASRLELRTSDKPEGPFRESVFEEDAWKIGAGHPSLSLNGGRVEYFTLEGSDLTGLFAVEFDR
jgi:tetratricopeptide (TPR) repeat protein